MRSVVCAIIIGLSLLPLLVAAQQPPITLDRLLPQEQQRALGFDRLSPQERAAVARLLQEVYELGVQSAKKASSQSPRNPSSAPSVIESQIEGEFNGWEGETIVRLVNGQIWQQTEYHYHYRYAYRPRVLVYRSGAGYKMKVDGIERAVGVEQLR